MNDFIEEVVIYVNDKDILLYPNSYDSSKWFFSYKYDFSSKKRDDWVSLMNAMSTTEKTKALYLLDVSVGQ